MRSKIKKPRIDDETIEVMLKHLKSGIECVCDAYKLKEQMAASFLWSKIAHWRDYSDSKASSALLL